MGWYHSNQLLYLLSALADIEICVMKTSTAVSRQGTKRHAVCSYCCALVIAVGVISVALLDL